MQSNAITSLNLFAFLGHQRVVYRYIALRNQLLCLATAFGKTRKLQKGMQLDRELFECDLLD